VRKASSTLSERGDSRSVSDSASLDEEANPAAQGGINMAAAARAEEEVSLSVSASAQGSVAAQTMPQVQLQAPLAAVQLQAPVAAVLHTEPSRSRLRSLECMDSVETRTEATRDRPGRKTFGHTAPPMPPMKAQSVAGVKREASLTQQAVELDERVVREAALAAESADAAITQGLARASGVSSFASDSLVA